MKNINPYNPHCKWSFPGPQGGTISTRALCHIEVSLQMGAKLITCKTQSRASPRLNTRVDVGLHSDFTQIEDRGSRGSSWNECADGKSACKRCTGKGRHDRASGQTLHAGFLCGSWIFRRAVFATPQTDRLKSALKHFIARRATHPQACVIKLQCFHDTSKSSEKQEHDSGFKMADGDITDGAAVVDGVETVTEALATASLDDLQSQEYR